MQNFETPMTTRVLGESQGYTPLHITDAQMIDHGPIMVSCWQPSAEELELLNAGKPVRLTIAGTSHPPVMVDVGTIGERN